METGSSENLRGVVAGIRMAAAARKELEAKANPNNADIDDKMVDSGVYLIGRDTGDAAMEALDSKTETIH